VDRFNNPTAAPHQLPWDGVHGGFQGGTLQGSKPGLTTCSSWAWGRCGCHRC
jgi:hypothetical protein